MLHSSEVIDVLVVIPTLNEEAHIVKTVSSLAVTAAENMRITIVVADGGSEDRTTELVAGMFAQFANLRLVHNPRKVQSAAVNVAVEAYGAGNRYLVRADAHAEYPHDFVKKLVDIAAETGAESVVVPMDSVGSNCFQSAVAWISDNPIGSGGSRHRGGNYSGWIEHGHHALFKLETFQRMGGYDASLTHAEDVEYDSRLRDSGGRIYMDASNRISYHPRSSIRRLAKQYFTYGRGRAIAAMRNRNSYGLRQMAISLHFMALLLSILLGLIHPLGFSYLFLYCGILAIGALWIAYRERSICGALTAPAALVMHCSWGAGFWVAVASRLLGKSGTGAAS